MNRLLQFQPEPFENEFGPSGAPSRDISRQGGQCGCKHAATLGPSLFPPKTGATARGTQDLFEMEQFEYEQSGGGGPCANPADVTDCSRVDLPEKPTGKITAGGSLAEGVSYDVTAATKNALKAVHLTHYNVNDWEPRKKNHREAIAQIAEFIDRYLSQNPGQALKVSITGSASRTGNKEYNDILSCRRSKTAAKLIRLGSSGYKKNPNRVIIDESGQGFCAATCKTKSDCENPDYRAVLVVVHKPDVKPDPIPPEPGSCLYQIRCCSFRSIPIVDLALDWLLDQSKVQELLKKYPMLKPLVTGAYSKIKNWLKGALKGVASKAIKAVEKYVYVEFIRVKAVFQIEDRDPHRNSSTLCYAGWGFRVKFPDVPSLDKEIDQVLKVLPEAARNVIKATVKKALKTELGLQHLEGKCAPVSFAPFQLSGQLQGSSNEPTCLKHRIGIFAGDAALGTDVTVTTSGQSKVQLAFMTGPFASGRLRLAKCAPVCDRNSIAMPLGQSAGFELFLASQGELKPGSDCNCGECTAALKFVRPVQVRPRRVVRRTVGGRLGVFRSA